MKLVVEGSRDLQKACYTVGLWLVHFCSLLLLPLAGMLQLSVISIECCFRGDVSVSYWHNFTKWDLLCSGGTSRLFLDS